MGSAAAVEGDVSATASSATAPSTQPAWQGAWRAGNVTETAYAKLTVNGAKIIHEASCTFSFSGVDTSVSPTPPSVSMDSPVTLTATTKVLQKGAAFVLVDGDSASDAHGNQLRVSASGHLTTD